MSLSNNKIKYIRSLKEKKFRNKHNAFVAEGIKLVLDLLKTCECQLLVALPQVIDSYPELKAEELISASQEELNKTSFLKTAPTIIAVFYRPVFELNKKDLENKLTLVLDGVQDPGNVGTIIRIANWFGIEQIICSEDTADVYNPKTIQATMGSIARVSVAYTNIKEFINKHSDLPIYGTFLDGNNIYSEELSNKGLIIMGSEGKGISDEVLGLVDRKLYIPDFPTGSSSMDSLNVAVATAIVCSEFRRRKF